MRNATEIDNLVYRNALAQNNAAFIFYQEDFRRNLLDLKEAFIEFYPKVRLGYSYKTNYIPDVCLTAHEEGALAEVVSEMEVEMALSYLKDKSQIIFNGPIKSKSSLQKVLLAGGIINIDNHKEIDIISEILAENNELVANVAFRLNIDYGEDFSRFGQPLELILEQIPLISANSQFNIIGFHLHLPHRTLISFNHRVEFLIETLKKINLSTITYINIGGGFLGHISPVLMQELGIENAPSYQDYAALIGQKLFDYFKSTGRESVPTLYLEPGSSVIADCVTFVSKIYTIKSFLDRHILVSYAGRHLLSPTNKIVKLPCEIINVQAPSHVNTRGSLNYEIAGYTCIESDILGVAEGDLNLEPNNAFIEFTNVGSYSVVMGSNFILPEPPIFTLDASNNIKLIRKNRTARDVLNQFS